MNGLGIIKGLGVTLKHFFQTYLEDLKWAGKRYSTSEGLAERMGSQTTGIFTIQYPDEKMPLPEEFRYIPFLIYDEKPNGEKVDRCTSCGICAKVCPPQCIWIERTNDPVTRRPIPAPKEFYIDVDICMNCGLCAEYCPFDAIKMDHDYEIATFDRIDHNIYNKDKLSKPASYYASIRPTNFAAEEAARAEKAARLAKRATG
jgi:NADH-quinone oxidoreductase subunit I